MEKRKYIFIIAAVAGLAGLIIYTTVQQQDTTQIVQMQTPEKLLVGKDIKPATVSDTIQGKNIESVHNTKSKIADSDKGLELAIPLMQFPPEVDSAAGLIKLSNSVFIGKIVRRVGNDTTHIFPATLYDVEVLKSITGNAGGKVSLTQGGVGYSDKNGKFYIREGDTPNVAPGEFSPEDVYLKTGGIYLFAAGYDPKKNTYGIGAPPMDRELITLDNALTDAQILSAAENNPRVREFMNAAGIKTLQSAGQ
jgi:hypothetical protein